MIITNVTLAQSDPIGHLHEDFCLLHNKVNQLESSITKQVSDSIQATVPLIKDFIKSSVSESIVEELPQVEAQELSKSLHNKIRKSISLKVQKRMKEVRDKLSFCTSTVNTNSQHVQDLRIMFKDMVSLLEVAEVFKRLMLGGEGEQPSAQVIPNAGQAPFVNEEKALVLYTSQEKSLEEDTSGKKETDDEPTSKKLKFLIPSLSIPSPTLLKSIMPEPLKVTEARKMTLDQFTKHLSKTTSSIFSHTPPREPTPPGDESKGKGIATEEPLKDIMPFMEEGGSAPKLSNLKSFDIPKGPLS
ncbi:hypothetical protein Tco_0753167 [Tanacetum coccineum]